jgi:hypothetical protein
MTLEQLELPLFTVARSAADDPRPEQVRTHPAQMVIRHCGKTRQHEAHAYHDQFPYGCPGSPDSRDRDTAAEDTRRAAERLETVREMEMRTYGCGNKSDFHPPHPRADGALCPGLRVRECGDRVGHSHHRWWVVPDAFYWCHGVTPTVIRGRVVEDVVEGL